MDIHQLRVFSSVFKNRSFSKAGEELRLSQPTVSDHVMSLEEELGCKLFDRMGRTIIPTKEAEVLNGLAIEIIEKAANIKDVIGQSNKQISGELLIGASSIPGTYLMPDIMRGFRDKYPTVSFQVLIADSREIVEKVLKHEILLGIVGTKLTATQLQFLPFIQDELIVVSSPSLIKDNRMAVQDLKKYPIILREEGSGTRRETEKILEGSGLSFEDLNIVSIVGSTDAVKQAVKAGLGIAIVSKFSVKDELKYYRTLKEIKLSNVLMERKFYIVTHKKRGLPAVYQAFLTYLKHFLEQQITL